MANRSSVTSQLISRIKSKDQVLYEILKNLNLDIQATDSNTTDVGNSVEQGAVNLASLQAEIDALEALVATLASQSSLDSTNALLNNHKDRHKSGGDDAFLASDLLEALIKRVRTVTADLIFGTIADGEFLKRDGSSIVGDTPASGSTGHYEPATNGDPVNPEILFDGNGDVVMIFVP